MAFRLLLLVGAVLTGARLTQLFTRFEISERSMVPTLHPGDYVIVDKRIDRVEPGSLVVYSHPQDPTFWLVKRVVGVAGDHVTIRDAALFRNGTRVATAGTAVEGTWPVGPGEMFVLGDNHGVSAGDSRSLGPISIGLLEGEVVFRYWPRAGFGPIRSSGSP